MNLQVTIFIWNGVIITMARRGWQRGFSSGQVLSASKEMGKVKYFPIVFDLRSDEMLEAVFLIADNKRFRWGEER